MLGICNNVLVDVAVDLIIPDLKSPLILIGINAVIQGRYLCIGSFLCVVVF